MSWANIPTDTRVFVDANVFIYNASPAHPLFNAASALFTKIVNRQIRAFTSAFEAAQVIHRVMIAEAIERFSLQPRKAVMYLKKHPEAVQELTRYRFVPGAFSDLRIHILDVTYREIHNSRRFRDDYGLLTNDSIILAVMYRHKLIHLATNDRDFARIPGIKVWLPH